MEEKIVEKIKKLISLSESPNKHEAERAMQKAQELMLKHNINMRTVVNHDADYVNETSDTFKRESPNMKHINDIIDGFFFVKVVKSKRRNGSYFNYIGEKNNVDTALHTVEFLKQTFDRLWKEYKAENGLSRSSKGSYCYGLYIGIREKLEQQRAAAETKYNLVLVDDPKAEEKMRELFQNLRTVDQKPTTIRDTKAMNDGVKTGKNVNFTRGFIS